MGTFNSPRHWLASTILTDLDHEVNGDVCKGDLVSPVGKGIQPNQLGQIVSDMVVLGEVKISSVEVIEE